MELITVFWILFLAGLFFAIMSALFSGFGHEIGGHDYDFSAGHDVATGGPDMSTTGPDMANMPGYHGHGEIALSPVSPITIATFVGCFGGGGVISYYIYPNIPINVLSALVVGFLGAFGVYFLVSRVSRIIEGSSEAKVGELIGEIAEVITPIQGEKMGEISYVFKGSRYNAPARSVDGRDISKNKPVKVWRIIGSTFYVKEISPEESDFPPEGADTNPL